MVCPKDILLNIGSDEYAHLQSEDQGPSILIVCWLFTGLALLFVLARLFVRGWIVKRFYADDYWCTLGWVCALLCTIFTTVATSHGNGRHCFFLTEADEGKVILWTLIAWWPGVACFVFPKLAVASLLTRLLLPSRRQKIILWALPVLCLISVFTSDILILFRCSPIQRQWDLSIEHGSCLSGKVIVGFSLYAASFSAFVDLYLSIYPPVVLHKVKIPRKKKMFLIAALGLGCVSCVVAIYKTTLLPSGLSNADATYHTSDLTIWTVVEGCVIIMACTVPALAPLLGYLRRHKFARGSSSEAVVQPMEEQSERGRHQGNGDPETCENATNRNVSSMTMFGDNDNAVVMHTQETPNAPNEEGSHQYFHKIAEGAG